MTAHAAVFAAARRYALSTWTNHGHVPAAALVEGRDGLSLLFLPREAPDVLAAVLEQEKATAYALIGQSELVAPGGGKHAVVAVVVESRDARHAAAAQIIEGEPLDFTDVDFAHIPPYSGLLLRAS